MSGNSRGSRKRSRRSGGAYGKKARNNRRSYDKLGIDPLREVTDDSGLKIALYSVVCYSGVRMLSKSVHIYYFTVVMIKRFCRLHVLLPVAVVARLSPGCAITLM